MKPIFLISNRPFTGKNSLALALALILKEKKYKVGYMKIFGKVPIKQENKIVDEEAFFIHKMLELKDPVEWSSPFVFTYEIQYKLFEEDGFNLENQILEVVNKQKDKDFLFMVGGDNIFEGYSLGIDSFRLVNKLNAKALVIQNWEGETSIDDILGIRDMLKNNFIGAVFNKIPPEQYIYIQETIIPFLNSQGIDVFGAFKRDKLLEAITVRDLLEVVNGGIVCCEDKLDELIENISIGAMDPDNAFKYFLRTPNKVVITGVYRTDIQVLALETSIKCLLLTGGLHPNEIVINLAKTKGVPIIVTTLDTFTTVDRIQKIFGKTMLKEKGKVLRTKEMVAKGFALEKFLKKL
ncbi:DRTGG domain-containing protein [Thermodesulfobacterium hydrogeniphilum]|uniref:DRTGG domain-containing protein n=1 Tax=Thermodesulfobacterium hydrogeniphilum TaxID=161156 RepID=UPI0005710A16|nr:DRTGG domain-containing protein [Thermodesulfobacterium hydrogeniphilum]